MDPKSCWWKDEKVVFRGGCGDSSTSVTGKAENMVAMINQRLILSRGVVQVEAGWNAEDGCLVRIIAGPPFEYHGTFPRFALYNKRDPKTIFWTRTASSFHERPPQQNDMAIPGFEVLFEIIFSSVIAHMGRIVIHPIGHDSAAETLYKKLVAHPKITHFEFLNSFNESEESNAEKTRTMKFCCKLLESCTHMKELLFENLKTYDDELVQKLFEAIGCNQGLETIDLRDYRRMTSWSKRQEIAKGNHGRGPISIAPLVLALAHPRNRISASLRTLHLGGAQLSGDSVIDLARVLPSLGLHKLSVRACGQDNTALVPLVQSLAKNTALRELDISHNLFCSEVMEQLCQSLKENKMLQRLVIEYCNINVEHLKCLAKALPDIKSLRYLLMDGNDFTHTPMFYGLDEIATELQGQFEFVWARPMCVESETGTFECHNPWSKQEVEPCSLGASILAHAMDANKSLFEVNIGENGFSPYSMSCCTTPPHTEHWSKQARGVYKAAVDRNYKKYQEMRSTRMQQAVVRIVTLALDKMDSSLV